MTIENDFRVWAPSGGSVMSQADYLANPNLANGVISGTADGTLFNKTQRQASIIATMLAQFIVQQTSQPVIDDGTTALILSNFTSALQTVGGHRYSFDESTPPGALFSLLPGDCLTITHAPASLIPLFVASVPGIYRLTWAITASTSTDTNILLFANGVQFTGAFTSWCIQATDLGSTGAPWQAQSATNSSPVSNTNYFFFDPFGGPFAVGDNINDIGPCIIEMTLSTYTAAKTARFTSGIAGGGAAGFSRWNDTITPWNQLGTLQVERGLVGGTVFIERIV